MLSMLKSFALVLLLLPLFACGGGGGMTTMISTTTPTAQKVELTIGLQGSGTVGAVDVEIVLPAGFILELDETGKPTEAALIELVSGGTMEINYIAETAQTNGMLDIGLINVTGFAADAALLKVSRVYAAGATLPSVDDFAVSLEAVRSGRCSHAGSIGINQSDHYGRALMRFLCLIVFLLLPAVPCGATAAFPDRRPSALPPGSQQFRQRRGRRCHYHLRSRRPAHRCLGERPLSARGSGGQQHQNSRQGAPRRSDHQNSERRRPAGDVEG